MEEMLHQRIFETGSYKSLLEHIALYEALKASIEHAQRDEFLTKKISLPQAPQSSAWKKYDTRDAPSSSSKQQFGPHAEQPVDDISIQDSNNISDSEDNDSTYLPDDERPATPESAWVIPTSYIPDAVNSWANALATTYQAPAENSLLKEIEDMRTFMNWYCQKMGKTELTQADLEGQAYEVGSRQALSISKMKAARYHDFGLELLVPEHMWIDNCWDLKDFKDSYYCSVCDAGYKDTTAAELQLLEDLLLSRG
ncbi:hypothetical protein Tco_1273153 [Tanacetum coccineum]